MLQVHVNHTSNVIRQDEADTMRLQAELAERTVREANGPGSEFLGWYHLPDRYDRAEFERILKAAEKIRRDSDVLIVAGIGGSYLGARAVIEALAPEFAPAGEKKLEVVFAGNNLSASYLESLLGHIGDRDVSVNVISKSGGTTETAVAFRVLRAYMEKRYGEEAVHRIFATTDKARGALRKLADEKGYECFVIPDDVGGRFSVLTAVGLLPIAAAGADISALMRGASEMKKRCEQEGFDSPAMRYAIVRNLLYRRGYHIEVLAAFEPRLQTFQEWWKQLFGESEGKDGKGIFPASVSYSMDLHSMGQYLQDGKRVLFESFLVIKESGSELCVPEDPQSEDGLAYLSGKPLSFLQKKAEQGTQLAHEDGGTPNLSLEIERIDEEHLGGLIFFFEYSCALSAYLNGVNPFNQPGVEAYKKNMFALLGKPSYEALRAELEARL